MIIRQQQINPIDFDGLSIFDYTANRDEKSSFAVIHVSPDICHRLSWSKRSDKYYYVVDGKIDFMINNENFSLNKGDFCLIKKGEKFNYKNNSNEVVSLILVHTPNFILDEEVFE